LRIVIMASGADYQEAAAAAASTFMVQAADNSSVCVLLPENEPISRNLESRSQTYGFGLESFPFAPGTQTNLTLHLKCQAFVWKLAQLAPEEIALLADADTCCLKPIQLSPTARKQILRGRVGMVPDIVDRHFQDAKSPWYLAPNERSPYVNSGVIFAAATSLPFFAKVLRLSRQPRFLTGPFHDQKVINFAFGRHFPKLLLVMEDKFNTISESDRKTVIAHFAGGAGFLGQQSRAKDHLRKCSEALAHTFRKLGNCGNH